MEEVELKGQECVRQILTEFGSFKVERLEERKEHATERKELAQRHKERDIKVTMSYVMAISLFVTCPNGHVL